jgi:Ca2+-binding EF-hand superfamily protein
MRPFPAALLILLCGIITEAAAQEKTRRPDRALGRDPSADEILRRLDTDGDGRVSKEEYAHREFDQYDRNRDGVLDENDVPPRVAKEQGPARRLKGLDKNGDGKVTFAEFADGPILDRFKSLDKDGSGYLERPEIEAIAAKMAADQRKRLPAFIARYDADHDGKVSRQEFPGPDAVFARMDRDRDGEVTEKDAPGANDEPLVPPPPPAGPAQPAAKAPPAPTSTGAPRGDEGLRTRAD